MFIPDNENADFVETLKGVSTYTLKRYAQSFLSNGTMPLSEFVDKYTHHDNQDAVKKAMQYFFSVKGDFTTDEYIMLSPSVSILFYEKISNIVCEEDSRTEAEINLAVIRAYLLLKDDNRYTCKIFDSRMNFYRNYFKRVIDISASGCGLLILSPLLALVTVWLHFTNKGAGAFFFQERPGKDGKIFRVVKYKTMTDERDGEGNLLPDAARLTKVGRFVRSTSIDELPQLWNVLKGDMSLIGPRPLLVRYLPLYSPEQARRHEVRPGITGWAQCHGRNAISWQKKFELDVWYVDHISFLIDCKIILTTIQQVIKRADISSDTSATMEPFNGKN